MLNQYYHPLNYIVTDGLMFVDVSSISGILKTRNVYNYQMWLWDGHIDYSLVCHSR
jgi:hypothetical protein